MEEFINILFSAFERNNMAGYLKDGRAGQFAALYGSLVAANEKFNLTSIISAEEAAVKHFADSLLGESAFPAGAKTIDVGAGAGFPSLPLAIARPDLMITALDSTAKKLDYIAETAGKLGLSNIKTANLRAEKAGDDPCFREKYKACCARAVAALPVLCELCLPLVETGGVFIAYKGREHGEELAASAAALKKLGGEHSATTTAFLSCQEQTIERGIIVIKKIFPTPREFPRQYAKIKSRPL